MKYKARVAWKTNPGTTLAAKNGAKRKRTDRLQTVLEKEETRLKLELKTIADEAKKIDDEEEAESEIQLEYMNPTHSTHTSSR